MTKIEPRAFPDCFAANAKKQKKTTKRHLLTMLVYKQGYIAPRLKSLLRKFTVVITIWSTVTKYPYLK